MRPERGRVLSVFLNLDPAEFATPDGFTTLLVVQRGSLTVNRSETASSVELVEFDRAGVAAVCIEDNLFPKQFARLHSKRGTPVFGLVVSSVLITGLLLLNLQSSGSIVDMFTDIIIIATLTALIPLAFGVATIALQAASGVTMFEDELGFLGEAVWFSGRSGDPILRGSPFYSAGWPVLLEHRPPDLPPGSALESGSGYAGHVALIELTAEGDGALAVVDVDTLWRRREDGVEQRWRGRAGKVYARVGGEWKMTMHPGLLDYPPAGSAG